MTVDNIITLARDLSSTSSSNVSDAKALIYANIVYHDLENAIVDSVDEDFFWDTFTADTVADQQEYTLPTWDATTEWLKKLLRVEVKYSSTDTYRELYNIWTLGGHQRTDDFLKANRPHNDWRFEYRENSIFLYPTPDNSVTWWLVVYGIVDLIDLVTWGNEASIFPSHSELRQYHNLIALGMVQYLTMHRDDGDVAKISYYRWLYEDEKRKMIEYLNGKFIESVEWVLPSRERFY